VLDEIELLITGGDVEIGTLVILTLCLGLSIAGEDLNGLPPTEGRVGQHHIPAPTRISEQRISAVNRGGLPICCS
jgi:hypothetical protein